MWCNKSIIVRWSDACKKIWNPSAACTLQGSVRFCYRESFVGCCSQFGVAVLERTVRIRKHPCTFCVHFGLEVGGSCRMCRWEGLRKARLIWVAYDTSASGLHTQYWLRGENVHIVKKGVEAVLVASEEVSIVVNAGNTKYSHESLNDGDTFWKILR
jgi:hypothetical protein